MGGVNFNLVTCLLYKILLALLSEMRQYNQ